MPGSSRLGADGAYSWLREPSCVQATRHSPTPRSQAVSVAAADLANASANNDPGWPRTTVAWRPRISRECATAQTCLDGPNPARNA
jgi:hypothetical protein